MTFDEWFEKRFGLNMKSSITASWAKEMRQAWDAALEEAAMYVESECIDCAQDIRRLAAK